MHWSERSGCWLILDLQFSSESVVPGEWTASTSMQNTTYSDIHKCSNTFTSVLNLHYFIAESCLLPILKSTFMIPA